MGAAVIPRLARELHNELAEEKGYSERNIKRMLAFYRAYPEPSAIVPRPVAQLTIDAKASKPAADRKDSEDSILWMIPWGHHAALMEKVDDLHVRLWYMEQTLVNGWSRDILSMMIASGLHSRQGQAVTNFERNLPAPQSDLARQI